jgi:hypothetical protein
MTSENITRAIATTDGRVLIEQPDGTYRLAKSQTDWVRLDAMSEAEVERLAAEDMAELGIAPDWMEHTPETCPPPPSPKVPSTVAANSYSPGNVPSSPCSSSIATPTAKPASCWPTK